MPPASCGGAHAAMRLTPAASPSRSTSRRTRLTTSAICGSVTCGWWVAVFRYVAKSVPRSAEERTRPSSSTWSTLPARHSVRSGCPAIAHSVQSPPMDVRELLELDELRSGGIRVLAGEDQLNRPVRWVHTGEIGDIAQFLHGGEVLLTAAT